MAEATLTVPLPVNPQTATKLVLRTATIDFQTKTVGLAFDLVDATGVSLDRRVVHAGGAQVQAWITNQESTLVNRLLTQLGLSGTVG